MLLQDHHGSHTLPDRDFTQMKGEKLGAVRLAFVQIQPRTSSNTEVQPRYHCQKGAEMSDLAV